MAAGTAETAVTAQPRPRRRRRWLAAAIAAALAAAFLGAIGSTHAAHDAQTMASRGQADTSYAGDATSPVVVHYRVLGLTMPQTLSLDQPLLIMLPYTACR